MNKKIFRLTVKHNGEKTTLETSYGSNLLQILHANGFEIYSPCGGNGTCGKCKVFLKDEGYITSCTYNIEKNIEIVLPDKSEASILSAQYEQTRVLQLNPGDFDQLTPYPLGIAIDIGTTTIVLHLVHLFTGVLEKTHTVKNPQGKFGADVISRINYCITRTDGLQILQNEIIKTINNEIRLFAKLSEFEAKNIVKISITGNTTMLHLLMGENPESLAFVPFTPVFTGEKQVTASSLQLKCHPEAVVQILPSFKAYVGADIVAGLASLQPDEKIKNYLFIDIGTNGEMALVTPDKILACATAAGPAFEGANIQHGMAAVEGAISIYRSPGNYRTIGGAKPTGICGSGLIDMVAVLLETGNISPDGLMNDNCLIVPSADSGNKTDIVLTQKDIREVQLAKSAVAAGIKILLDESGIQVNDLDAVFLAGGFGNYIRTESAIRIGIFPDELKEKIIPVGNTSASGALLALKSLSFKKIIDDTLHRMEYVELSENENFEMEFAMNMMFD